MCDYKSLIIIYYYIIINNININYVTGQCVLQLLKQLVCDWCRMMFIPTVSRTLITYVCALEREDDNNRVNRKDLFPFLYTLTIRRY